MNEHRQQALIDLLTADASAAALTRVIEDLEDLRDKRCEIEGHDFIDDQCGKPAHRFCHACGTTQALYEKRLARQTEADEVAVRKTA